MKLVLILLAGLGSGAMADSLKCTIQSGTEKDVVHLRLADKAKASEGLGTADGVYDLGFWLQADCTKRKCTVNYTLNSASAEDEVGQAAFNFTRGRQSGPIYSEPLTNAPDRRAYTFSCEYIR